MRTREIEQRCARVRNIVVVLTRRTAAGITRRATAIPIRSVDRTIAVVVTTVSADFRGKRVHFRPHVIAIACDSYAIQLRHAAFQLIVRVPEAVAIAIGVPVDSDHALIDEAVTVVVFTVAQLRCAGIGVFGGVVAVAVVPNEGIVRRDTAHHLVSSSVAVAVEVFVPVMKAAVVRAAIAIVVDIVFTHLRMVWVNIVPTVIAVGIVAHPATKGRCSAGRNRRSGSKPVAVAVEVPRFRTGCTGFIHQPVAVVIDAVADFARRGVSRSRSVVAIVIVSDMKLAADACANGAVFVAEAVVVGVHVPGWPIHHVGVGVVDAGVAVVVHAIADLVCAGVNRTICVIAIVAIGNEADGLRARLGFGPGLAVAVAIKVAVPRARIHCVVIARDAIAVVVDAVAPLGRIAVDGGVVVLAVVAVSNVPARLATRPHVYGGVALAVGVGVAEVNRGVHGVFVHLPVAVVVRPIAPFRRAGVDFVVGVVAVEACTPTSVTVGLRTVADEVRLREPVTVHIRRPLQLPIRAIAVVQLVGVVDFAVVVLILAAVASTVGVVVVAVGAQVWPARVISPPVSVCVDPPRVTLLASRQKQECQERMLQHVRLTFFRCFSNIYRAIRAGQGTPITPFFLNCERASWPHKKAHISTFMTT